MIRFSKNEEYAILLLNTLAAHYKKRLVPLSEVAQEFHIPILFLRNIANTLVHAGLIRAIEGKKGGYSLKKAPSSITLGQVLKTFSQRPLLAACGGDSKSCECGDVTVCHKGTAWRRANQQFLEKMANVSLGEFVYEK